MTDEPDTLGPTAQLYPKWICQNCGDHYGQPVHRHTPSYRIGSTCGWCNRSDLPVTNPRNFGYPRVLMGTVSRLRAAQEIRADAAAHVEQVAYMSPEERRHHEPEPAPPLSLRWVNPDPQPRKKWHPLASVTFLVGSAIALWIMLGLFIYAARSL